jgi:hypothetical protein
MEYFWGKARIQASYADLSRYGTLGAFTPVDVIMSVAHFTLSVRIGLDIFCSSKPTLFFQIAITHTG